MHFGWYRLKSDDYSYDGEYLHPQLSWDQAENKWDRLPACQAGIDRLEAYPTFRITQ